tara:strand:+ start:243 stop:1091 length:849 start_codon:yes stop_codon:yes gene_type:complete
MSKKVIVEGKNGTHNIRISRQATNESNWSEDLEVWNRISQISTNDPNVEKVVNKKGEVKFKFLELTGYTKAGKPKYKNNSEIADVITTLAKKIANNNALEYDITYEDEVEFSMVLDLLGWLLEAPKKCQKFFCRNASRQSVDEDVQIQTVRDYTGLEVQKPTNGEYTVANGEIQNKKDVTEQKFARSVDAFIPSLSAYGFLKYSGPVGSVTSVHQVGESKSFIEECKQYCDKYQDGKIFFVQVDGGAGEDHLPEMLQMIREHSDRIFAGNSEQVIDWLNAKK